MHDTFLTVLLSTLENSIEQKTESMTVRWIGQAQADAEEDLGDFEWNTPDLMQFQENTPDK